MCLHPADLPAGAVFKGYEPYVVQELRIACHTTRYWRARYELPTGGSVLAPLPADVLPGSHFGPTLVSYVLDQYHQAHVTQPLLLQQLQDYGIDISAGQLNRLLTEGNDAFHDEKAEVLAAGLQTAAYIGADDTGARHQGRNGYCTAIGNDLFACFESSDSKSRLNFLQVLHGGRRLYALNDVARAYWERQGLAAAVVEQLGRGPQEFADESAWLARLAELGITAERPVRIATEGALLGGLSQRGVSPELVVLSDGRRSSTCCGTPPAGSTRNGRWPAWKGLVKDRLRLKDPTYVLANIAIPSPIVLVAPTRPRLLAALRPWAAERVAAQEQQAEAIRAATADLAGEERLRQRVAHRHALTAGAEQVPAGAAWAAATPAQRRPLEEALQLARKVLADRDDPDGPDHLRSVQDSEARTAQHGDYFTGYLLDVARDADSQIVTALNVLPGHGPEALDAGTLLAQEEQAHGHDVQAVSMDAAGFPGAALRALTGPGGPQVEVYVPPKEVPPTGFFTPDPFALDATGETLTCPNGQRTSKRRRSYRNGGWAFRCARAVCAPCPLPRQCVPRLPQTTGRVVLKNHHEEEYRAAWAKAQTAAYQAVRREHPD